MLDNTASLKLDQRPSIVGTDPVATEEALADVHKLMGKVVLVTGEWAYLEHTLLAQQFTLLRADGFDICCRRRVRVWEGVRAPCCGGVSFEPPIWAPALPPAWPLIVCTEHMPVTPATPYADYDFTATQRCHPGHQRPLAAARRGGREGDAGGGRVSLAGWVHVTVAEGGRQCLALPRNWRGWLGHYALCLNADHLFFFLELCLFLQYGVRRRLQHR
jgi:hypothetical protein